MRWASARTDVRENTFLWKTRMILHVTMMFIRDFFTLYFLIPLIYRFWVFFFFINKFSSRTSEYLFTIVFRRSSFRFTLSLSVLSYIKNRINIHVFIEMRYWKSHFLSFLLRIHMKIFFLRIYFALRSIATQSHFQMSSCRYDCSNFI